MHLDWNEISLLLGAMRAGVGPEVTINRGESQAIRPAARRFGASFASITSISLRNMTSTANIFR